MLLFVNNSRALQTEVLIHLQEELFTFVILSIQAVQMIFLVIVIYHIATNIHLMQRIVL